VLQTLALGGIVTTLVVDARTETIAAIAIALMVPFSGAWNGEVHASPAAALAFVPLTLWGFLVGRACADPDPSRAFVQRGTMTALAAGALAAVLFEAGVPFNKVVGSSSFVALATAVSAACVAAAAALERAHVRFPSRLLAVGRNALTAWVLQYVLLFYPAWMLFPAWNRLRIVPGLLATVASTAVLSALTVRLERRGFRIRL